MAKLTLNDLANLDNPTQAISIINANNDRVVEALENTLSRDGTTPNAMEDDLNMDGNRILNLPAPVSDTEPARHGQLQQYVDEAEAAQVAAQLAETNAEAAETNVTAMESNVEAIEANIEAIWADVQVYGTPAFYDIGVFVGGPFSDNETVFSYVAPRGFEVAAGSSNLRGVAGTAATASTVVNVNKNGVSFGTLTWSAAGTVAVASVPSLTTFVAGDVLSFVGPASADDTLGNVSITLLATRQP